MSATSLDGTSYGWDAYVDEIVAQCGSLAKAAERIWGLAPDVEDVASIERGLRRLRARGQRDGGDYGRRLLHLFGLPRPVTERLRWMGIYHARFADLPVTIAREVLQAWNRPPVSQSQGRVWIELGFASAATRSGDPDLARAHLARAEITKPDAGARIEGLLLTAYLESERSPKDVARVAEALARVEPLLADAAIPSEDRESWRARWLDQRAHLMTSKPLRTEATLVEARALYETIGDDATSFAITKRETGLAFVAWKLGDRDAGLRHAARAVESAGDAGLLRLRASALNLEARILGGDAGSAPRARAERIARHLADEELLARVTRR